MTQGRTEPYLRESAVHPTGVYLYRLRSVLRRRWTEYVLLAVLVSLVGGLAMGSVVAGRRTQSAYGAFLGRDDASTLTMSTYGLYNGSSANNYSPQVEQQVRQLPAVAQVESWIETYVAPLEPNGAPNLAALRSLDVAGSVDGVFFHEDRVTVLRGRMADPTNPSEFMASESGARVLGVRLGQTLEFGRFDAASASGPGFGAPTDRPAARFRLRLVGIVEFNNSVVQDDTDRVPTNLILTPAQTRAEWHYANGTWFAIRLKPGEQDVGAVEQQLLRILPPGALGQFYLTATVKAKVESALRPESIALGVFGLISALAVLGLCLPIMGRLQSIGRDEQAVLRALGASRAMVAADFWAGVVASVLLGALLGCVVAAGLGSLAPLGPVHTVYHPAAFTVDWAVTGMGVAVLAGIPCGAAVVMGARSSARPRGGEVASGAPTGSRAVGVVAAAGMPAPAVIGTRFALEPGHGPTSVAAKSVLAGGIVSVTLVVATLTFASGLRTLVSRPALYGWDWGYTLIGNSNVPPDALSALQHDPSVQAWSGYIAVTTTVDGSSVPVLIATNSLSVAPPVIAGHQISDQGQILLGRATLSALNKRVGDTVRLGLGDPGTAPLYLPPQPLKIVGVATFPAVAGSSNFADHTSMGIGGLFSFSSLPQQFVGGLQNPDPVQNGPVLVFVRYRPGTGRAAALADIDRIVRIAARQFAGDPQVGGASVSYLPVQRPAPIVNYQSTGSTPLILASGLAAAAIVALVLSMVGSVRRRRQDLAVLKTLGFVRRQMIATVATQALVTGLLAAAIGVPLGVAAGRQLWIAFARSIYAVPEPTVPASVALVAAGTVAIAVAVALIPGRIAARTPAAVVLRTD